MMNARTQAIARESASIDASQSRAIAARQAEDARPRTALELLSNRLNVSPGSLQNTLINTVFKGCSEAEFVALVVVANTYNLNPLLREIYAFPKKGGGIQAIVGYDGWVKIMNDHPQFDGIEFNHIEDASGALKAVECVIYRKDRTRPVKKMIYLKEFKRNTEPWNNSPHHMLDVRVLCHTVRLAFGVAAGVEGEEEAIDGGTLAAQSLPSRQTLAEELDDEIPAFDQQNGEIVDERPEPRPQGITEVPEEAARELDSRSAAEQTLHEINGPLEVEPEPEPEPAAEKPFEWQDNVDTIKADAKAAMSRDALKAVEQDYLRVCGAWPKDICDGIEALFTQRRKELSAGA